MRPGRCQQLQRGLRRASPSFTTTTMVNSSRHFDAWWRREFLAFAPFCIPTKLNFFTPYGNHYSELHATGQCSSGASCYRTHYADRYARLRNHHRSYFSAICTIINSFPNGNPSHRLGCKPPRFREQDRSSTISLCRRSGLSPPSSHRTLWPAKHLRCREQPQTPNPRHRRRNYGKWSRRRYESVRWCDTDLAVCGHVPGYGCRIFDSTAV